LQADRDGKARDRPLRRKSVEPSWTFDKDLARTIVLRKANGDVAFVAATLTMGNGGPFPPASFRAGAGEEFTSLGTRTAATAAADFLLLLPGLH